MIIPFDTLNFSKIWNFLLSIILLVVGKIFCFLLIVLRISSGFILLSGLITFVKGYKTIIKDFGFENSNFNKLRLNLDTDEDGQL